MAANTEGKDRRMAAYVKTKTSQAAARLMVCLVARSGEGRRRVISDLVFALSCGRFPTEKKGPANNSTSLAIASSTEATIDETAEMWALQSWGELCMGLSAPRSSNALTSQDSNSVLSFEVIKLMLDYGAAHALMVAIERVKLHHPMASSVASSLVRPIEIFTRGSVYKTVTDMAAKEKARLASIAKKPSGITGESRRVTFGPSQRSESSFVDDSAIDNAFMASQAEDDEDDMDDEDEDEDNDEEEDESMEDSDDDDVELIDVPPIDYSDGDSADEDDEEISSDSEDDSDDMEEDDSESDDEDDDLIEVEEDDDEEEPLDSDDEDEAPEDWEGIDADFFDGAADDELAAAQAGAQEAEDGLEGWTRIDNAARAERGGGGTGLGNMLLDMVQPHGGGGGGRGGALAAAANGGFLMDAAETMLGNMLRSGEIGGLEGLSEIEDTLGIRVVRGVPDGPGNPFGFRGSGATAMARGGASAGAQSGGRPAVHQNSHTASSNSIFGGAARGTAELTSMDFVYGGPAAGGASSARSYHDTVFGSDDPDGNGTSEGPPSQYDTHLFPGGLAASTHSQRSQPSLHPLLRSIQLPPVNSIRPTRHSRNDGANSTGHRSARATAGIVAAGSNVLRVNDRYLDGPSDRGLARRTAGAGAPAGAGWVDDGMPPDRATEEFSVSFGNALNSFLQESTERQERVRREADGQNDDANVNVSQEQVADGSNDALDVQEEGNNDDSDADSAATTNPLEAALAAAAAELDEPAQNDNETDYVTNENNNGGNSSNEAEPAPQPAAQESPSEEAAEVSSAMANGLTIASDNDNEAPSPAAAAASNNDEAQVGAAGAETLAATANDEEVAASANAGEAAAGNATAGMVTSDALNNAIQAALAANANASAEGGANENEDAIMAEAPDEEAAADDNNADEGAENDEEVHEPEADADEDAEAADAAEPSTNPDALTCPPEIDPEVFASLPLEMQQEIVQQHAAETSAASAVVDIPAASGLDPEALAALPEDMRNEILEQERREQRLREERSANDAPADPANAEDMDNASFLASLAPDLRQEILLTADDAFISSLPQTLIAEANVLRERVATQHRRRQEEANAAHSNAAPGLGGTAAVRTAGAPGGARREPLNPEGPGASARVSRRQRNGKFRIEADRQDIIYAPADRAEDLGPLLTARSAKAFLSLLYLLSPVQPQRTIHKVMLNMCLCGESRGFFLNALLGLLSNDRKCVAELLDKLKELDVRENKGNDEGAADDEVAGGFPPSALIGVTPDPILEDGSGGPGRPGFRGRTRQAITNQGWVIQAASLPASARGSSQGYGNGEGSIPPVVARRVLGLCSSLCKSSARVAFSMLCNSTKEVAMNGEMMQSGSMQDPSCFEKLLDLLERNQYSQSATGLEQLLSLMEIVVAPLSLLPKDDQDVDLASASPGREWVKVPRVVISKRRLHLLISTLRLESCKDSCFLKVNTLTRRLSRVEANRECILHELALVAEGLGKAAILDLKAVSVRLSSAAKHHREKLQGKDDVMQVSDPDDLVAGSPSSAVSLSTSNSELKLLRVLQMLNSLCTQEDEAKSERNPPEFVALLHSLKLESLWDQLSVCLKTVSVLEGVANMDVDENEGDNGDDEENNDSNNETVKGKSGKKLQNSVAGLITRFLPAIEAFFMVNASSPSEEFEPAVPNEEAEVDNSRVVQFAASNKILLNALLRSNPQLLEKGLRAMVKMPKCRLFLDFDVKRQWFKTQVRRLRQQASRRHGSFRLNLRRKHVFEDSFHAFIHRNADELRGRLHITFANEEGVDAGGLSREFFAILAKEMFNPNYALFMSTEDGCTFQPNPNSSINPDDMRYFRFVGRIVGKAVVDGFLLDAHFTRSLYKHMLGVKPTHHDMQAIDPDYYKNLQMIMEHNLEDIGLELTFSTEDHCFGRSQTIDLIPDGRNIPVTEESKERYVDLVCQHRMTTAIQKQIKAYLEGFHEMVDSDLISIFTAKELELLISGMPDIDIHDLKKNTDYNGYRPADKEIGWFWNIMFVLTRSEKAAFLQFVTGSSKVPLAGFSELQGMRGVQKFSINKASGPSGALMSAHTCFNALDLPVYKSEEEMKDKLLYAISEGGGGFGFA